MVRHRQAVGSSRPVGTSHRNVLCLAYHLKPESAERSHYSGLRGIDREFGHLSWDGRFYEERLDGRAIRQDFVAESLDVEPNGRFDIREGFFVTVAFAHHHPLQTEGVSHIPVRVFLDNDLNLPCHFLYEVYHRFSRAGTDRQMHTDLDG